MCMKHLTLLLLFVSAALKAQIPNSDVELWDNQPVLLQWQTNSRPLTLPPYNPYVVVKDTDAFSGTYSANFIGNGVFHSYGTTTFAINNRASSLELQYKLLFPACVNANGSQEKDTVSVLVEILNGGNVVDQGYHEFNTTSVLNWTNLLIPISSNSLQFDSCRISITGGKVYGGCGIVAAATEFKVDHLTLNSSPACNTTGVVVEGLSCLLIDTGTGNLLMPCNLSLFDEGFKIGDTLHFSYAPNNCASICMQGDGVDITCLDTGGVQPPVCNAGVTLQKLNPTSHLATNGKMKALTSGLTAPITFTWSNGESGIGLDTIDSLYEGAYCVIVSDVNNCTARACDTLIGGDVCIDSSLICPPGSLCCDAPFVDPVCGCDSVTYTNACIATNLNGVTGYAIGPCLNTAINNDKDITSGLVLSPVPVKDKLSIAYTMRYSGNTQIQITDILGRRVKDSGKNFETPGLYKTTIDLTDLRRGIYFIEVKNEAERKIKKFVVE